MARPLRIEYLRAVYHVTGRGNEKKNIFKDDQDREAFLRILARVNKRYHWLSHALLWNYRHKSSLKGRLSFNQRYRGKNIFICFISGDGIYLYPHDKILDLIEQRISDRVWIEKGTWSSPTLT
jgi:hypothetical protein